MMSTVVLSNLFSPSVFQGMRNSVGGVRHHRRRFDFSFGLEGGNGGSIFTLNLLPTIRRFKITDLCFSSPLFPPTLLLHSNQLRSILNFIRDSFFSSSFGWFLRYNIVGYNFTLKTRFRRSLLRLNLGYSRHKFVLVAPPSVRFVARKKRRVIVFSYEFPPLFRIAKLIHNLRNITPYKVRGLILEGGIPYPLKQGKKVKFR